MTVSGREEASGAVLATTELADAVVTATQRELVPALRDMLRTTQKDRENSQWYIGYPVTLK